MRIWIPFSLLIFLFLASSTSASGEGRLGLLRNLNLVAGNSDSAALPAPGKPAVLLLFKACCAPADQAFHWAKEAHVLHKDSIDFVAISVDPARSGRRLKAWLRRKQPAFPVLSDPTADFARAMGVYLPPTVILLDHRGVESLRTFSFSGSNCDELNRELIRLRTQAGYHLGQ